LIRHLILTAIKRQFAVAACMRCCWCRDAARAAVPLCAVSRSPAPLPAGDGGPFLGCTALRLAPVTTAAGCPVCTAWRAEHGVACHERVGFGRPLCLGSQRVIGAVKDSRRFRCEIPKCLQPSKRSGGLPRAEDHLGHQNQSRVTPLATLPIPSVAPPFLANLAHPGRVEQLARPLA
jgi:hypothetical protein